MTPAPNREELHARRDDRAAPDLPLFPTRDHRRDEAARPLLAYIKRL
jgi:hypothetical protein